jgi:alcohol dehydrogenase YqhD (iron-dependent ADH family)
MKAVAIVKKNRLHPGCRRWIHNVRKFISGAVNFEGKIEILQKRILIKMVPFGTVLTLPATGEMNSGALW